MIKLLQKYKMYVLVVAGIMIMIAFLLGDVIQQLSRYSFENERVYTLDGQKVSKADLQNAGMHLEGLKRVVHPDIAKRQLGIDDDATQWQLATAAAERAGVIGGPADGRSMAVQIATQRLAQEYGTAQMRLTDWKKNLQEKAGLTDEQVDARISQLAETLLANAGRTGNAVTEGANAFAEYRGLLRLLQAYGEVPQTSENRLAAEARRLGDTAVLRYIYVPLTEARIAAAPAPTPEEMQAQFDKFKDKTAGVDGPTGYRPQDRVTYSWFSVDRVALSKAVKVDPIEVAKRAMSRAPDGKVEPGVRRQIEDEIRGELTQRAMDDFTSQLRSELLSVSARLPDKDGYKVLPADWKKPDLSAVLTTVVGRIAADKKIAFPLPTVNTVTTPQDARAFISEKGIGTTMLARSGQQPILLRDVLFSAKELGKPVGKLPAQVGLPIPTGFTGFDGNLYFVMLDSATPSATPKSLDEVRALVEKDLRKVKALEMLKVDIEARLAPVVQQGMIAAPDQLVVLGYPGLTVKNGETRRGGYAGEQFGQRYSYLIESTPGVPAEREVQDTTLSEAAVSRAEKLDPTKPVDPTTAADRTFVHPLSSGDGAVLTQVTGLKPITIETFRLIVSDPGFRAMMEAREIGSGNPLPFNSDALIKRLNVTGLEREKKAEEVPVP